MNITFDTLFLTALWVPVVYVIGSFPFGLFIAKVFCNTDPRLAGSCNTGATNVARLCGMRYGVTALVLDLLKGLIPAAMATIITDCSIFASLTVLAAIVGHMYSCFLDFKGGKGFATMVGGFAGLAIGPLLIVGAITIATIYFSGFVSLGALVFGATLPIALAIAGKWGLVPVCIICTMLLYWKHKENIQRLAKGEEMPFRKGKK